MRLSYLQKFDCSAPKVARVELELIEAVRRALVEETSGLERSKAECVIRRKRLMDLSMDWSLTRELSLWKKR
jgi:hypothetical protein